MEETRNDKTTFVTFSNGTLLFSYQNKNRLEALAAAKKVVNTWVEAGKPKVKTDDTAKDEKKELDTTAPNKSAVEALAKVNIHAICVKRSVAS